MSKFSRNLAFIIGINNYGNGISPLKTAVNDAQKIVEIIREKHGYKVWVCLDKVATLSNLNQLLEKTLPQQVTKGFRQKKLSHSVVEFRYSLDSERR